MSPAPSSEVTAAAPGEPEVVYEAAVEGLFKVALKHQLTPLLEERLRAAGLDLRRPLSPTYTRARWNELLRITASTLWADDPPSQAFRVLGRRMIEGYSETLLGQALLGLARLLGPRRMLERMTRNLRSGCNYNLTHVVDLGPREVSFWINEPSFDPAFVGGMIDAVLQLAGGRDVRVDVLQRDAKGCTYRLRWA